MNRTIGALKEWINPSWGRHRTVRPMDAGLRPNNRLAEADVLLVSGVYEPDDVLLHASGTVLFSSGDTVFELRDGQVRPVASPGGAVGCLASRDAGLIVAVEGVGLVSIGASGATENICTDPVVSSCVTDMAVLPDGSLLVTVGSLRHGPDGWARALIDDDRSGLIVRVDGARARVEAERLGWPAGIETASDTEVLLSLSLDHRIEARAVTALSHSTRVIGKNMPVYPGRLSATDDGWWVAAPCVRNGIVEMLLDEPEVLAEMKATIDPDHWFVPRLRAADPYTDTLQEGQLRVQGVIKPWAPARCYGLAFRLNGRGRVVESAHSRVDGDRHGVTGVAARDGQVVVAARGYRNLLALHDGEGS